MSGWNPLEILWQDARYALRGMRRSPVFCAVAVLSLALGIGANTAIFSLVNTLLLRPLPVHRPAQLVEFLAQYPGDPPLNAFSWRDYERFRDNTHVFSAVTGQSPARFTLRGAGLEPEAVDGNYVIANFFQTLGIQPALGRFLGPQDDSLNTAVVSWAFWKSRFNLDPKILNQEVLIGDTPVIVVGVAPKNFSGLQVASQPAIWLPLPMKWSTNPHARSELGGLRLLARLQPGISIFQARLEMAVLFRRTAEDRTIANPNRAALERQLKFTVEPAGAGLSNALRDQFSKPLLALLAIVALLLLIACTNVAGMLLARGAGRRQEMAVRVSLGAGRFRLVGQVLTESLLLSLAGALLGIFFAWFGAAALLRIITSGHFVGGPPQLDVHVLPDARVLLFTGIAALLTGILFGLAPAWSAVAAQPAGALRAKTYRRLLEKSLVVAQVALSVGLLSAAALFIRNLKNLQQTDLGFSRGHVLLVALDPGRTPMAGPQRSRMYQDLLARFEQIPGVRSATISGPGPLSGAGASRFVSVEGHPEARETRRYVSLRWVAPKYFQTLGTPLLGGRDFAFEDQGRARVAIVNQAMARYYFGGSNPIGKYVSIDGDAQPVQIVGVAGDAKYYEIREAPLRTIYLNTFQYSQPETVFALRTSLPPESLAPAVRRSVRDLLKTVPVLRITTLAQQIDATIVPERLIAFLSGVFGALGALLAAIGIYGLLAYTVARRIHEIGIRMALGATQSAISHLILGEALAMTCAGLVIGVPLAYWSRQLAASLIQNLPIQNLTPIALGAVLMIAIALLAAYGPARRAARVDPMEALRYE